MKFELYEKDGEVLCCSSCNFPVPTYRISFSRTPPFEERRLCIFCSTTMAGRHTEYPPQDTFSALRAEIWKAAAGVFHMLGRAL